MKRTLKLFLITMMLILLIVCTTVAAETGRSIKAEPVCEPAGMFLAGVGLVGFAVMVRKRFVK